MDWSGMKRRTFIKVSGAAAAVASGGIEGILAARRAPAWAQGTKLHWVRWVDFIPESDVELKRQMPEAGKALGCEIQFETINANDLQPRITAAIQSGSGADIFIMQYNWAQLYHNALVDVTDLATDLSKAEGGFYDIYPPADQINGRWLALPNSIVGNAVAYRKSWLKEAGADHYPKTWDEARKLQDRLYPLHAALFTDASPAPTKYALSRTKNGFPSELRLPLVEARAADAPTRLPRANDRTRSRRELPSITRAGARSGTCPRRAPRSSRSSSSRARRGRRTGGRSS